MRASPCIARVPLPPLHPPVRDTHARASWPLRVSHRSCAGRPPRCEGAQTMRRAAAGTRAKRTPSAAAADRFSSVRETILFRRSTCEFSPGGRISGRHSRSKGACIERSIVNTLLARGIAATCVPLSAACGGRFAGDIVLPLTGRDLCVEVQCRGQDFRELYSWLDGRDVLIVKADRREPLAVVRLSLAAEIS